VHRQQPDGQHPVQATRQQPDRYRLLPAANPRQRAAEQSDAAAPVRCRPSAAMWAIRASPAIAPSTTRHHASCDNGRQNCTGTEGQNVCHQGTPASHTRAPYR
jgi:hypothetical protein